MKIVNHAQEIVQNESKETAKPRVWAPRVFNHVWLPKFDFFFKKKEFQFDQYSNG